MEEDIIADYKKYNKFIIDELESNLSNIEKNSPLYQYINEILSELKRVKKYKYFDLEMIQYTIAYLINFHLIKKEFKKIIKYDEICNKLSFIINNNDNDCITLWFSNNGIMEFLVVYHDGKRINGETVIPFQCTSEHTCFQKIIQLIY